MSQIMSIAFVLSTACARGRDPSLKYTIDDRRGEHRSTVCFAGTAGDFDRDGVTDVLSIECLSPSNVHELRVYSGANRRVVFSTPIRVISPEPSAIVCGDIDGDTIPDLLVGFPPSDQDSDEFGRAQLISGRSGALIAELTGSSAGDLFGASLCALNDVDRDGVPDFAIAAPRFQPGPDVQHNWSACRGYVQVYSGRTRAVLFRIEGRSSAARFGQSLACAGDVDGDGSDDWIAGAPGDGEGGSAIVVSGRTGVVLREVHGDVSSFRARTKDWPNELSFATSVAGLGDVDGDGVPDFAVSAIALFVDVFSGKDGSRIARITSPREGDYPLFDDFGRRLACAGDVDHEGHPDLLIGSPGWEYPNDSPNGDGGRVWVYSARDARLLADFQEPEGVESLGGFVSAMGDVDGDGNLELLATTESELRIYSAIAPRR